jgi:hypothetical protein
LAATGLVNRHFGGILPPVRDNNSPRVALSSPVKRARPIKTHPDLFPPVAFVGQQAVERVRRRIGI